MILRSRVACHRAAPSRVVHSPGRRAVSRAALNGIGTSGRRSLTNRDTVDFELGFDFPESLVCSDCPWRGCQLARFPHGRAHGSRSMGADPIPENIRQPVSGSSAICGFDAAVNSLEN